MKKKYIILIALLIVYLFLYKRMTHMNEDDLDWVKVYEKERVKLFATKDGIIDTLFVRNTAIHNSTWPFIRNEASDEYTAGASIDFYILHMQDTVDGILIVRKDSNEKPAIISFRLCDRYAFKLTPDLQKFIIDNKTYDDCIVVDSSNSKLGIYQPMICNIKSFIWSKSKGLIKYTFEDGTEYCLME